MVDLEKEIIKDEKKVEKFFSKKENIWMTIAILVSIALILVLILPKGGSISKSQAEELVSSFGEARGASLTIINSSAKSSLYEVFVSYQNQEFPLYVTKDGKYVGQMTEVTPVTNTNTNTNNNDQTPVEVPKTDKPKVELFVMSYCPFGTQAEKGIIPIYEMLGDKVDATIRFVHYTMHGEKEDTENFRQICIREEQKAKLLPYLKCILNSTNPNAPADVNVCMASLGINTSSVSDCIANRAENYYKIDSQLSNQYGVQGSPTLVINGVQVSSQRSPAAYLSRICSAFNNSPSDCGRNVSSTSSSAGFGYSASDSNSAATCG